MQKETAPKTLLEIKNLSKIYEDGTVVLDNVSFKLRQGEFTFLVGESGAGKSTIVRILIREEEPSGGEIYLKDVNILEVPKEEIHTVRRRIGVVFQDFKLLPNKTVRENVGIALDVANTAEEEKREIIPNILQLVGLEDKINKYPYQLSGGEKQRVAIARALAHEPDILVADEPTGMIDPQAGEKVMQILEHLNKMGTTILMTTHDRDIVDKAKRRVIRISKGRIVSDKEGATYNE